MGFETRNGRRYLYKKEREGGRVVSKYIGGGDVAKRIAGIEAAEKAEEAARRQKEKDERQAQAEEEARAAAYCADVEAVFRQAMAAAGYHRHKRGEWRRRRGSEK